MNTMVRTRFTTVYDGRIKIEGPSGEIISVMEIGVDGRTSLYYATLFAVSPEMLDALEYIVSSGGSHDSIQRASRLLSIFKNGEYRGS